MQTRTAGILRSINNKTSTYNILTACTHHRYQSNLGHLDHQFYLYQKEGFVKWNKDRESEPRNHILLDGTEGQIKPDMTFDIILAQQIFGQYQHFKPLSDYMNIPLIRIEHTQPTQWKDDYIDNLKVMRGDINVFISDYSVKAWHFDPSDPTVRVIRHGVDTEFFKPDRSIKTDGKVLNISNDFINRGHIMGFDIFQRVTNGLDIHPVGDTKGFSDPSKDKNDLLKKIRQSSVYLNTTRLSPIPTSLLEAMACGMPVITTATSAIPEVVVDGHNGFISNDEKYLRDRLEWCLKNPEKAQELGDNARKTILQDFSLKAHLDSWDKVFKEAYGTIHK